MKSCGFSGEAMKEDNRSQVQEALLYLYLRLNGYFLSSFIVHSPECGKNKTQIDALAVRHAFNREPGRQIGPSPFLHPKGTDLLICEVKSRGQQLQFNEALREDDAVIQYVLRWAGLFDEEETMRVGRELKLILRPATPASKVEMGIAGAGEVTVRPLLCSPERRQCHTNQPWFVCGDEIFSYIAKCVNPQTLRDACSTRYDITAWGSRLTPIVSYFKQRAPGNAGEMSDLYKFLAQRSRE
jgi:hypothetical protein